MSAVAFDRITNQLGDWACVMTGSGDVDNLELIAAMKHLQSDRVAPDVRVHCKPLQVYAHGCMYMWSRLIFVPRESIVIVVDMMMQSH